MKIVIKKYTGVENNYSLANVFILNHLEFVCKLSVE